MMSEPLTLLPNTGFRPRMRRRLRRVRRSAYLRRLFHWGQLDFEFAAWQMLYLLVSPKRVYRNIYYHKQTKNQWARDDPAFVLLQTAGLVAAIAGYSFVYGVGLRGFLRGIIELVLVNYFLAGILVSTTTWIVTNRFLKHRSVHSGDQSVEWQYAFDVHCNGFFAVFVLAYVLQLFFLPVLMKTSWVSLFLGNSLFALAASAYLFISYLGFRAMPFLQHQEVFLYFIPIVAVAYLTSLFGFNISHHLIDYYF